MQFINTCLISFALVLFASTGFAQNKTAAQSEAAGSGTQKKTLETATPEKQLNSSDVSKFIKTYKPLLADLEAFGDKYSGKEILTVPQAMSTSEEAQSILKKHGWNEEYYVTFGVIAMGYSVVKLEKEFEALPKEQQEQMKAYNFSGTLASSIHPDDLKLIRVNFSALDKILQN